MVSTLEGLEALLRVIGLPYAKRGDSLIAEYEAAGEKMGIVITLDQVSGVVRAVAPTDVEPTEEGLRWLLSENFSSTGYHYALDYEGFIAVVSEQPARCVENARHLREMLASLVEGYRKLMERVEKPEEG
ncbi:MAG: hypothetical protein GXO15_02500 [Crenarchaeota archaeon]|nr:hypothetical protein [Thermoproteota archaeon]